MINLLEQAFYLIVVLGVLIFIHELGHFLMAKAFGVRVEVFSLGFGRRLLGFRRGETDYRVAIIPLGGYVKMAGEMFAEEDRVEPDHFTAKPRWQRLIVMLAGPVMNVALALGLWWGMIWSGALAVWDVPEGPQRVESVAEGSAAAEAGIEPGDRIVAIGGEPIDDLQDYSTKVAFSAGQELVYRIERDGRTLSLPVKIDEDPVHAVGHDGVRPSYPVVVAEVQPDSPAEEAGLTEGDRIVSIEGRYPWSAQSIIDVVTANEGEPVEVDVVRDGTQESLTVVPRETPEGFIRIGIAMARPARAIEGPLDAASEAWDMAVQNVLLLKRVLGGLFSLQISPKVLSGPLEIARISQEVASQGFTPFLHLLAFISIQLGLFNLLPIPVLDGGQILILLTEMASRRDLPRTVKERVLQAGFVFILIFASAVLALDVYKRIVLAQQEPAAQEGPAEPGGGSESAAPDEGGNPDAKGE